MKIDQAVRLASEFLDALIARNHGFSPTGDPTEFRLEFQEAYAGQDASVVLVFVVPPDDDPDDPSPDVRALAERCKDDLAAAHPELLRFGLGLEYLS